MLLGLIIGADLGSTAIRCVKRNVTALQRHGGRLLLCGVSTELRAQLDRTGPTAQLGECAIFDMKPRIGTSIKDAFSVPRSDMPQA